MNGIAHSVSPGDIGTVSIVSKTTPQARDRLKTIRDILSTIGVPHKKHYDTIQIIGHPLRVSVYAATVGGVVSQSSITVILDEVARWTDSTADGENPADEVIGSIGPSLAQDPDGILFGISSPMTETDAHARMYDASVDHACAWTVPTWIGNPTLPEERCRQLCTRGKFFDEAYFNREYAAIPVPAGETSFFDPGLLDASLAV